jgi:hypothetical protein
VVANDEDFSETVSHPGCGAPKNPFDMPLRIVSYEENRGPIFLQRAPGGLANIIQMVIREFWTCLIVKGGFKQLRILSRG